MPELTSADMTTRLLAEGFQRQGPAARTLSDPIADTPMVVTLDELRPYELDPRITRNPLYDEIKASIRERGLDAPPSITRRPNTSHYIIRNGGNTRLAVLRELWSETKDERFFRISCLFRPWPERGEIIALTGHLAENELHGGLTFIERALGVEKARELYEQEHGKPLSQSELARRLAADGYPVQQSHISRMQESVRYLLPAIPNVLYGGLGRHQAERLAVLRKAAEWTWEMRSQGKALGTDFTTLFHDVLAQFDAQLEAFTVQRVQDELIGQMSELLGIDYNTLELDIVNVESRQRAVTRPPAESSTAASGSAPPPSTRPILPPQQAPSFDGSRREQVPKKDGGTSATRDERTPKAPSSAAPAHAAAPDDEHQRLQAHVVSPATSTERLQAIQQLVAEHTGEVRPDFADNVLRAIPVQAGGLFPISDVWYIEPGLDTPEGLRTHIAQFANEIAAEADLTDCVEATASGVGFVCLLPTADALPAFSRAVLTLLRALPAAPSSAPSADPQSHQPAVERMLGELLVGSWDRQLVLAPRLSDAGLVKLFRLLRLARRLLDLESVDSADRR